MITNQHRWAFTAPVHPFNRTKALLFQAWLQADGLPNLAQPQSDTTVDAAQLQEATHLRIVAALLAAVRG